MSDIENFDTKTNAQVNEELESLLLEEKRLDLELKREAVAVQRAKRQSALDRNRSAQMSLLQFIASREARQARCNHRKGGIGVEAVVNGEGTSAMYAVIKHKLPIGRYWIQCQRCGKEWQPANNWNVENGRIVPTPATPGYDEALRYPTDNTASGSSTFLFERTAAN